MPYSKLIREAHEDFTELAEACEKDYDPTYEDWQEVQLLCDITMKLHQMKEIVKHHVTEAIAGHHNPRGRGRM